MTASPQETTPEALVYGEVAIRLLDMDEPDKAYELFVLAGSFAMRQTLGKSFVEPIIEER